MVQKPRIYQILRRAGLIETKEDALRLVRMGKIVVNGKSVKTLDFQANPKKDDIFIGGKKIVFCIEKRYFILNKPVGYLTSKKESEGKRSVMDFVVVDRKVKNTLFPVGRLDYSTSGLIIITNDGELAHQILQPRKHIEKEYRVVVEGYFSDSDVRRIEEGVSILVNGEQYTTLPAKIKIVKKEKQKTECMIIITEGKKRQVRLMMQAMGHLVIALHRTRIGGLTLEGVAEGKCREYSKEGMYAALFPQQLKEEMGSALTMDKYRFLEHTADAMFEAFGKTLEELFAHAALAVEEIQVKLSTVGQKEKRILTVEGEKIDMLLFDFLQELIYLKDAEQLLFSRFSVSILNKNEKYRLTATCFGEKINPAKHELDRDAKAITLHHFEVEKEKDGWKARVIVDI